MQKADLQGLVILLKSDKSLIQTKRISVFQRENMVDLVHFLIPYNYEGMSLEPFQVTLQMIGQDTTIRAEKLERMSDGNNGYEDYEDADGNKTHMIYVLPIKSTLTQFAGDITLKLTMDYVDYAGQTESNSDNEDAPEPEPIHHVFNSDTTVLTVKAVADYYSIVPDESLAFINNKIAELQAEQKKLEETANIYDAEKADNLVMHIDQYGQSLYLTSHGHKVGDEIDLNDLGDAISDWQQAGLVKVITDEEDPSPSPEPTPMSEKADDIVLVINQNTKALYLLSDGHRIGNPIYLDSLGDALADFTPDGLVKVVTDDDNGTTVITGD